MSAALGVLVFFVVLAALVVFAWRWRTEPTVDEQDDVCSCCWAREHSEHRAESEVGNVTTISQGENK